MRINKCPYCGASVSTKEAIVTCQYCNSTFTNDNFKETKTDETTINTNIPKPEKASDNPFTNNDWTSVDVPPRPKLNLFIILILFFMGFVVIGIVYILIVHSKQKEWDKKYK